MNLALIVPGFSANEQDWCIPALRDFVHTLAAADRVTVFALRYPYTRESYDAFGARVVPLGGRQRAGLRRYPLLSRAVSAVVGAHAAQPFDIVHAIWADEPGWVGAAAARRLGLPLVVSLRGGELEHRPGQRYGAQRSWFGRVAVERSLRRADYWTVGSHYMLSRAVERVPGIDVSRGVLAPAGVDLELFSLATTGVGRPFRVVLSVASLTPIKNLDLLIRAFRIVRDRRQDAELHLIGDGTMRDALERERDELGLADAVVFHGARPREQLPHYYREAALTVVASHHESQCLAAVEAAACGCPVAGFPIGIVPELRGGARVIPERTADAVARTILDVLEHREARDEMGARARRAAEELFDLKKSVDRIRGIYADALARRPRRAATTSV